MLVHVDVAVVFVFVSFGNTKGTPEWLSVKQQCCEVLRSK